MKRLISLFLIIMLLASVFVGCTAGKGENSGDGGKYGGEMPGGVADVSAETLAALANSGTVTVYQYGDKASESKSMSGQNDGKDFTEYFEQVYGGNLVKRFIVFEGWEDKFIAEFAAGDAPDVVNVHSKLWPKAASRSMVLSREELKKEGIVGIDHPVLAQLDEQIQNNFTFNGGTYTLDVFEVSPVMMAVNNTLIKDCGIDKLPSQYYAEGQWNWNNWLEICRRVCAVDKNADGNPDYSGYSGWNMQYIMRMNGAHMIKLNADGTVAENLDDVAVQNALQMVNDLYKNKYTGSSYDFTSGKLATFAMDSSNVAKKLYNSGDGLNFDYSVLPMPIGYDNVDGYVGGGTRGHAVVSSSKNLQGAVNYVIARTTYYNKFYKSNKNVDLIAWFDDDGKQMFTDLQSRLREGVWEGVGSVWSTQWNMWTALRQHKGTVKEFTETWKPYIKQQCDLENSYR